MRLDDGRLVVGELEVTEPGLYLDVLPANAEAFADVVAAVVKDQPASAARTPVEPQAHGRASTPERSWPEKR